MSAKQKDKLLFASTLLLVIIYAAGFLGIHSSYQNLFLSLTPFSLFISTILLFLNHKQFNKGFLIFCCITFLSGFFIEVIGVNTGIVFGEYGYGNTLGFKLNGVPLIIGINWLMLVYCTGSVFSRLNTNVFIKSLAGATLLVLLDIFIEPVAMKYDFWNWKNALVPFQNYIAWFLFAFLLLLVFYKSNFNKENKFATALIILQFVFFILMGIT